jgi:hypothetical protein
MEKLINIRHGDIALIGIDKLPTGLKKSVSKTILQGGSGGNSHTFDNGVFYLKADGENIIGYLKAEKTKLFHVEHSPKGVKIKDGTYEVRRQVEFTHEGMKQVID